MSSKRAFYQALCFLVRSGAVGSLERLEEEARRVLARVQAERVMLDGWRSCQGDGSRSEKTPGGD